MRPATPRADREKFAERRRDSQGDHTESKAIILSLHFPSKNSYLRDVGAMKENIVKGLDVEALLDLGEWRVQAVKQCNEKHNQTHPAMLRKSFKDIAQRKIRFRTTLSLLEKYWNAAIGSVGVECVHRASRCRVKAPDVKAPLRIAPLHPKNSSSSIVGF